MHDSYHAYSVGTDGNFRKRLVISAQDDADAINRARRFIDGEGVELWDGARLVMRFNCKDPGFASIGRLG